MFRCPARHSTPGVRGPGNGDEDEIEGCPDDGPSVPGPSRTIQAVSEQRENPGPDEGEAVPSEEPAWWEAEGMPWKKEPQRADYLCLTWFGVVAVFSLILLPTRAGA